MSKENDIRVALIGYGIAGSVFHAPLIDSTDGLRLSAIVTANPERSAKARADFPKAKIVPSAEEIWNSADHFDLVVVASPNKFHFAQGKAALESGLSVILDKPMATSSAQCEELIDVGRKTGKLLTVFHNRRWDGDFLTVRRLIEDRALGDITRLESRYERFRPQLKKEAWRETTNREDGGGLLLDLGSHLIDQACALFGAPNTVYAELEQRREGASVDDDVFVALNFPGGVRAHLWASSLAKIKGPRFRLLGMEGSYEKYGLDPQEEALRDKRRPGSPGWGVEPENQWGRLAHDQKSLSFDGKVQTVPGCYEKFYSAMRDAVGGKGEVPVKPDEALLTMRVIEAAIRSSRDRVIA